ncbi:hypothetical protein FGO68_gene4324 [Halteria grandinella]|uniref:Uncharacterized protein n=1 Tax=Halteria grandinella TaxID=5974 RepID=A0A8J8T6T7_HALGN|nr:hypothetical protein FGO68_gene4324 [Halteria grandinella]
MLINFSIYSNKKNEQRESSASRKQGSLDKRGSVQIEPLNLLQTGQGGTTQKIFQYESPEVKKDITLQQNPSTDVQNRTIDLTNSGDSSMISDIGDSQEKTKPKTMVLKDKRTKQIWVQRVQRPSILITEPATTLRHSHARTKVRVKARRPKEGAHSDNIITEEDDISNLADGNDNTTIMHQIAEEEETKSDINVKGNQSCALESIREGENEDSSPIHHRFKSEVTPQIIENWRVKLLQLESQVNSQAPQQTPPQGNTPVQNSFISINLNSQSPSESLIQASRLAPPIMEETKVNHFDTMPDSSINDGDAKSEFSLMFTQPDDDDDKISLRKDDDMLIMPVHRKKRVNVNKKMTIKRKPVQSTAPESIVINEFSIEERREPKQSPNQDTPKAEAKEENVFTNDNNKLEQTFSVLSPSQKAKSENLKISIGENSSSNNSDPSQTQRAMDRQQAISDTPQFKLFRKTEEITNDAFKETAKLPEQTAITKESRDVQTSPIRENSPDCTLSLKSSPQTNAMIQRFNQSNNFDDKPLFQRSQTVTLSTEKRRIQSATESLPPKPTYEFNAHKKQQSQIITNSKSQNQLKPYVQLISQTECNVSILQQDITLRQSKSGLIVPQQQKRQFGIIRKETQSNKIQKQVVNIDLDSDDDNLDYLRDETQILKQTVVKRSYRESVEFFSPNFDESTSYLNTKSRKPVAFGSTMPRPIDRTPPKKRDLFKASLNFKEMCCGHNNESPSRNLGGFNPSATVQSDERRSFLIRKKQQEKKKSPARKINHNDEQVFNHQVRKTHGGSPPLHFKVELPTEEKEVYFDPYKDKKEIPIVRDKRLRASRPDCVRDLFSQTQKFW